MAAGVRVAAAGMGSERTAPLSTQYPRCDRTKLSLYGSGLLFPDCRISLEPQSKRVELGPTPEGRSSVLKLVLAAIFSTEVIGPAASTPAMDDVSCTTLKK